MTDNEYIAHELNKARPLDDDLEVPAIKVRGPGGESRWVNIPPERFAAVVTAASSPPVATYCACCTGNQCECEGASLKTEES